MLKNLTIAVLACEQDKNLFKGWIDNHDGLAENIIVSLDMFCSIKEQDYKNTKSKIKWIVNPINNDFASARNNVLKQSKTNWTLFLDMDELLMPFAKQSMSDSFLNELSMDFYYFYRINLFNRHFVRHNNYHAALIKKGAKYKNMSPNEVSSPGCYEKPEGAGQLLDPKLFQILHLKDNCGGNFQIKRCVDSN